MSSPSRDDPAAAPPASGEHWRAFDAEAQALARALRAERLTVLVGAAGVGKTTLLVDGLLPLLHRRAGDGAQRPGATPQATQPVPDRRSRAPGRGGGELCYFVDEWSDASLDALVRALAEPPTTARARLGVAEALAPAHLAGLSRRHGGAHLLFVFDHFERLIDGAPRSAGLRRFADAWAALLRAPDLDAHLLVAVDESAWPRLQALLAGMPGVDPLVLRLHTGPGRQILESLGGQRRTGRSARHDAKSADFAAALNAAMSAVAKSARAAHPPPGEFAASIDAMLSRVASAARVDDAQPVHEPPAAFDAAARQAAAAQTVPGRAAEGERAAQVPRDAEAAQRAETRRLAQVLAEAEAAAAREAQARRAAEAAAQAAHAELRVQDERRAEAERDAEAARQAENAQRAETRRLAQALAESEAATIREAQARRAAEAATQAAQAQLLMQAEQRAEAERDAEAARQAEAAQRAEAQRLAQALAEAEATAAREVQARQVAEATAGAAQAELRADAELRSESEQRANAGSGVEAARQVEPHAHAPAAAATPRTRPARSRLRWFVVLAAVAVALLWWFTRQTPPAPSAEAPAAAVAPTPAPAAAPPVRGAAPAAGAGYEIAAAGAGGVHDRMARELAAALSTEAAPLRVVRAADGADPLAALRSPGRLGIVRFDALRAPRGGVAPPLRVLAPLFSEELLFVVRADSPLRNIHELNGRRVGIGAADGDAAHTVRETYRRMFGAEMIEPAQFAGDQALAELVAFRSIDAMAIVAPQARAWWAALDPRAARQLRLLTLDPRLAGDRRVMQALGTSVVRSGAGAAKEQRALTPAVTSYLVASGTGNDDAERLTALAHALCRELPRLRERGHPSWRELQPAAQLDIGWPVVQPFQAALSRCVYLQG